MEEKKMESKNQYQTLKYKNKDFRYRLEHLENKLDELIVSDEITKENKKIGIPSKIKKTSGPPVESTFIKREYMFPVRRVSIFGALRVKLLKWTLLTVDIPNLHIDLKRVDQKKGFETKNDESN
jgi:hypothetical protein